MTLPKQFLESLEGISGFERDAFLQAHEAGNAATSVRINPAKYTAGEIAAGLLSPNHAFNVESQVPWSQYGYYLSGRPSFTFDPLFHAGRYYVQEASSMFLEQALMQHVEPAHPLRMLDLSAAPGGKSTHMLSLASKGLLVSNEVIRNRAAILAENITRWGLPNIVVTSNDPSAFGRLEHFFDVLVVDAPCSGSGLFRKDPGAISEWSPAHVTLCSRRQQRILADALPA
ncbi:MAG TPA: RsmB/NOP family class I SAM-dependent RNA methyltransferase, partial [Flavisolibacter sp.]